MNATVFETTTEGILVTDAENRIKTVNPAFTRITGYQAEEVIGRNPKVLSSGRHDQAFYAAMWEQLQRAGYWNGEVWNRRKDGSVYPEWLSLALIRWRHPRLGLVSSERFIPLAEETGVIDEIGRWVIDEACRTLASWRSMGHDWGISINLSSRQLALGLGYEEVLGTIRAHDLPTGAITLEITEGMMLEASDKVLNWLESIHGEGAKLSVDDFGTGYSSLSYLKRFPVDAIKIDRSFVKGLPESREDFLLVSATLSMARSLGLGVVAEGIETPEQAHMLSAQGCPLGQGYLYSKPTETEALAQITEPLGGSAD